MNEWMSGGMKTNWLQYEWQHQSKIAEDWLRIWMTKCLDVLQLKAHKILHSQIGKRFSDINLMAFVFFLLWFENCSSNCFIKKALYNE